MSHYLKQLKANKLKILQAQEGARTSLVPCSEFLEVMRSQVDNDSYKTWLTGPLILTVAQSTWGTPSSEQLAFTRLLLALWLSGDSPNPAVDFIKEYFHDVLNNYRGVSLERVTDKMITCIKADPQLDYIELNEEFKSLHPEFQSVTSVNAYREVLKRVVDPRMIPGLIKPLFVQNASHLKTTLEFLSGVFLLSFIKTGNVTSTHLAKRVVGVLTIKHLTLPDYSSEDCRILYDIIKNQMDKGVLSPNEIISYFTLLLSDSTNMRIKPLVDQASYRNLTALYIISKSFSEFPDFPWGPLLKIMPSLRVEAQKVFDILKAIGNDSLIGYQIPGASTSFPNLAGLCLQLQIVVKNQHTLMDYKGVGSLQSIGKVQLEKFKKWAVDYSLAAEGMTVNITEMMKTDDITKQFFELSMVGETLNTFLSEKLRELEDDDGSNELKRFFGGGGSGPDDDEGPPPPPRGPTKRPHQGDSPDHPSHSAKQRGLPSAPPSYPDVSGIYPAMDDSDEEINMEMGSSPAPLGSKEAVMDIPSAPPSPVPGPSHGTSTKMSVNNFLKVNLHQRFQDLANAEILNGMPKDQIFSARSAAGVKTSHITIDPNTKLFICKIEDIEAVSNLVLIVGVIYDDTKHMLKHALLISGMKGSSNYVNQLRGVLPEGIGGVTGFLSVAMFVITASK